MTLRVGTSTVSTEFSDQVRQTYFSSAWEANSVGHFEQRTWLLGIGHRGICPRTLSLRARDVISISQGKPLVNMNLSDGASVGEGEDDRDR